MTTPMEMAPPTQDDSYFADARDWSRDINGALRASNLMAWRIAGAAVIIAMLEAMALVTLTPLKTVVPYTITVDRQTGAAQLARGVDLGPMAADDALIQSALAQYVLARETLDATDLSANYRKVGLWSSGTARSDYLRSLDRSNPQSVLNGANAETQISTTVASIALLGPSTALVRFSTDRREGSGPVTRTAWMAAMEFGFSGTPLSSEDRLINPLGFQVARYRRDADGAASVVPPSVASIQAPAAPPAAAPVASPATSTAATIVIPNTPPRIVTTEPAK
jgi:type IV secretion system protein VirB8